MIVVVLLSQFKLLWGESSIGRGVDSGNHAELLLVGLPFKLEQGPTPNAPQEQEEDWEWLNLHISFVAVLSMERSSSTFLANRVLVPDEVENAWLSNSKTKSNESFSVHQEASEEATLVPTSKWPLRHFISLNEIFQTYEQQSGDAWTIDGVDLLTRNGERRVRDLDVDELIDFLLRVSKRRCRKKIQNKYQKASNSTTTAATNSAAHQQELHQCFVTFKAFDSQLPYDTHKALWKYLPDLRVAILNRDVKDRWRSKWFAETTGERKIAQLSNSNSTTIPPVPTNFERRHTEWYRFIDMLFVEEGGPLSHIPHLSVDYRSVIDYPLFVREQAMDTILSPDFVHQADYDDIVRHGGFYDHSKKRKHPTSSLSDCSSLPTASDSRGLSKHMTMTQGGVSTGNVTVACMSFQYQFVEDSFLKSGSIITGVLSSAQSSKRRQVCSTSDE